VPELTCPTAEEEALRDSAVEGRREQLSEVVERYGL